MKLTFKIYLLIAILILSLISIFGIPPSFSQKGVLISSVEQDSLAFEQGFKQGQVLTSIDGKKISSPDEFYSEIQSKFISDKKIKVIFETKDSEIIYYNNASPKLTILEIPNTQIKMGLDLAGGSRALIKAEGQELGSDQMADLISITSNRFNVYGISDVNIRAVSDLSGSQFMLVEIAGATPKDLKTLISEQGKFEAKIGNQTVFTGGENQGITSVGRSGQQAAIESCQQSEQGYFCNFRFTIYLSEQTAQLHADITNNLTIDPNNPEYLSEKLDLYLDDNLVDSLFIGKSLKGSVATQISISGSGSGETNDEAYESAKDEMNQLQTVLITGSLPYKLEIVKLDTISPLLGHDFIRSILFASIASLLAVSLIIFIRYRNIKSSLALILTSFSEIIIILGIASLIEWNLDLPSIAGIIATIGTGIDQQIIVLDEAKQNRNLSIAQRMKRAFTIILGAYFTALVALLPLLWAGAGLLKGFAITTIIGITVGVLITRPAFVDMIKRIEK